MPEISLSRHSAKSSMPARGELWAQWVLHKSIFSWNGRPEGETYRWDPKAEMNVELLNNEKANFNQYSLDVQMVCVFDIMMQTCCVCLVDLQRLVLILCFLKDVVQRLVIKLATQAINILNEPQIRKAKFLFCQTWSKEIALPSFRWIW